MFCPFYEKGRKGANNRHRKENSPASAVVHACRRGPGIGCGSLSPPRGAGQGSPAVRTVSSDHKSARRVFPPASRDPGGGWHGTAWGRRGAPQAFLLGSFSSSSCRCPGQQRELGCPPSRELENAIPFRLWGCKKSSCSGQIDKFWVNQLGNSIFSSKWTARGCCSVGHSTVWAPEPTGVGWAGAGLQRRPPADRGEGRRLGALAHKLSKPRKA